MIISIDTEKVAEKYSLPIHILNCFLKNRKDATNVPFPPPQFSTQEADLNQLYQWGPLPSCHGLLLVQESGG